jgi:lysophospholipase L1-like esterase
MTVEIGEGYSLATDSTGRVTGIENPRGLISNTIASFNSLADVPDSGPAAVANKLFLAGSQIGRTQRREPVRVVTFGDSTATFGETQTAANQDTSKVVSTTWGASLTNLTLFDTKNQIDRTYPMAAVVGNCGISGQTTTQFLARDALAESVTRRAITDAINMQPDVILFKGGSINDLLLVTSGTVEAAITLAYNNRVEALNRFITSGIPVIDSGVSGFTNGTANTATDLASSQYALIKLNALVKAFSYTTNGAVLFIDPIGVTCDVTGAYLANRSKDGTHLNPYGQYLLAKEEAKKLTELFGTSLNTRYKGYNNCVNSQLTATASSGIGITATNITVTATNSTRQNLKIEAINGIRLQTGESLITATSNSTTLSFQFDLSATGTGFISPLSINIGDIYGIEFNYYVEALTPGVSLNIAAKVDIKDTPGRLVVNRNADIFFYTVEAPIMGKMAFPPIVFGAATATLLNTSLLTMTITSNDSTGTYKWGISALRVVKLDSPIVTY